MSSPDVAFRHLRHRLVDAGLPPRRARRVTRELADHYADLLDELAAAGVTGDEAARTARFRLGSDDDLAREILARDTRRSIIKRYPALMFPMGPLALAAGIFLVSLMAGIGLVDVLKANGLVWPGVTLAIIDTHYVFASYLLVPLTSLYVCWTAREHRLAWHWPLVGLLVLAFAAGLLLDLHIMPPLPGEPGSGEYSVGFHMAGGLHIASFWRLLTPFFVFLPFLLWSRGKIMSVD